MKFSPIIEEKEDGHIIPTVGAWSEQKYRLLGSYCDIFTSSMRRKWGSLVYIDICAGAGYSKIEDSGKILRSSSLIALSLPVKFDRYILCEKDPIKFKALSHRAHKLIQEDKLTFFNDDCNVLADDIVRSVPKGSLCFCFADPFSLDLHFATIQTLAKLKVDILVLLALHMDANRNFDYYINETNKKIEYFLGNKDWRTDFYANTNNKRDFVKFLAGQYTANMLKLGYVEPKEMQQIRSGDKNLPLYYLAFYSKHPLGNDFWKKISPYKNMQRELF